MQDRSVEKTAILFTNPKKETTPHFYFRTRVATGVLPRDVLPALFRGRVAKPLLKCGLSSFSCLWPTAHLSFAKSV